MGNTPMYGDLAALYDLFIDWPSRLKNELPLLERLGVSGSRLRIVDVACGTGHHARALAERGHRVIALDAEHAMIEQAKAIEERNRVDWRVGTFLDAPADAQADVLLCLGTSLPHVESVEQCRRALKAFGRSLRPGGRLIVHSRNLPKTLRAEERFLPPIARKQDGLTVLFWRFYDLLPPDHVRFHLAILREEPGNWTHTVLSSLLTVASAELLAEMAGAAGFENVRVLGHLDGRPYDLMTSPDLVLVAERG